MYRGTAKSVIGSLENETVSQPKSWNDNYRAWIMLVSSAQVLLPGHLCFYLSYCHCCYTLNCSSNWYSYCFPTMVLVLFQHAILMKILKSWNPGCASSCDTFFHLNKSDSTCCLFIVPYIKHTIGTKQQHFALLVLNVRPRVTIIVLLIIYIATAHVSPCHTSCQAAPWNPENFKKFQDPWKAKALAVKNKCNSYQAFEDSTLLLNVLI
jgi:hypothetical protein